MIVIGIRALLIALTDGLCSTHARLDKSLFIHMLEYVLVDYTNSKQVVSTEASDEG